MLREEEKDQASNGSWKTFSRSVSWTERPPRKTSSKPQWNSKARACLPPLQPLSIIRPSVEEWPKAGSDDLGVWPNPPTPRAKSGSVTPRENSTLELPPREFEFRKDKLAFFDKECSRILDHIYLGSDAIAKNREILRQNGITHVLNCVGFVCPEYFKNELVYRTLWLQDCPSEDITSILYDVYDYFEDVREQNGRVLVHCCQGVSRSTSLVIAYLMWKEGQSFDDAFQHVKAARGVTNPNVGFACQLLQCQKRVHALPPSPTSVLRMYRMAPHSPYDPLHLVPKMLCEPGAERLDSRGAFIIHIPSALYVWIGKLCSSVMADNARAAASQIFRYERVQGSVITVIEGEEAHQFWDALTCSSKSLPNGCHVKSEDENISLYPGQRKIDEYDLDFEIFHKALSGGVVPPFPLSEAGSETCLPAGENRWNRLRRKFASGIVKELIASSKLTSCSGVEDVVSPTQISLPSSSKSSSSDSFASSNLDWTGKNLKEVGFTVPRSDAFLSKSPSFSLVESFSSFLVSKPKSNSTSPSVSPSTSDYSSSFTFSPSSSNWSDLSFVSAQPSPYGLESRDTDSGLSGPSEESVGSVDDNTCLLDNATSSPPVEASSESHISIETDLSLNTGDSFCSLAERRGSKLSRMNLPSIDEVSQISGKLTRCLGDDVMEDAECIDCSSEAYFAKDDEIVSRLVDEKKYAALNSRSDDDITNKITEATKIMFYQWPSMQKMDMHCAILDSRSIYIIHMPTINCGTKTADVLYIWVGCKVPSIGIHSQSIGNRTDSRLEDSCAHLKTVCQNLLTEKGFSKDAQVQIVKEGEEPVNLLKNLARLSIKKQLDRVIK